MIPREQRIEYFWDGGLSGGKYLDKFCDKFIKDGYIIHQIIPDRNSGCYYLLLYKY